MDVSGITNGMMDRAQINKQQAAAADGFQAALDTAMAAKDKTQLKKACLEFESYYLGLMFKEMRKTVDSADGIFPKSQAEKIFQEMLDEEVSKSIASGRGIGLADMMYKQMEKNM